jgi:hypothetical protein
MIKNKKGEYQEKSALPAFIYGVISIKKFNHNLTSINNLICIFNILNYKL